MPQTLQKKCRAVLVWNWYSVRNSSPAAAEPALVHLDHQRVLAPADGAVAHGEFGEVRLDLEANRAAVTAAAVRLKLSGTHAEWFL